MARRARVYRSVDGYQAQGDLWHGLQGADSHGAVCELPGVPDVANPNLLPETSTGYESGRAAAAARSGASGHLFSQRHHKSHTSTYDPVTFISSYANIGKATTQGVESFASGVVSKQLRLRADYTYTDTRDDTTGLALLRRRRTRSAFPRFGRRSKTVSNGDVSLCQPVVGHKSFDVRTMVQPG